MSWPLIVGVAAGALLILLAVVLGLAWWLRRRARRKRAVAAQDQTPVAAQAVEPVGLPDSYMALALTLRRPPRGGGERLVTIDPVTDGGAASLTEPATTAEPSGVDETVSRFAGWPVTTANARGEPVLRRIIQLGKELQTDLPIPGLEWAIPQGAVKDASGRLVDCTLPATDSKYIVDGSWERLLLQDRERPLSSRLAILERIGGFLQALHDLGWAFGSMRWQNILLAEDGTVCLLGLQYAREIGGEPAFQVAPDAAWRSQDDLQGPSFDLDRYQFALLTYRYGLGGPPVGFIDARSAPVLATFSAPLAARWGVLLDRAAGPIGARPAISEWLTLIELSRSGASV